MALLKILTFPNPILRERSQEITIFDDALSHLAEDMIETMYDAPGVGLAANQIGVTKRIAVLDVDYHITGRVQHEINFTIPTSSEAYSMLLDAVSL